MPNHHTPEKRAPREAGGAARSKAVGGHSLAAAAVCLATGAAIGLTAIFGGSG